jgi:hypothetical protein
MGVGRHEGSHLVFEKKRFMRRVGQPQEVIRQSSVVGRSVDSLHVAGDGME